MKTQITQATVAPVAVVAAALLLVACGSGDTEEPPDDLAGFSDAVESGASCPDLFEIRNAWDPKSTMIEPANETLREIGCYSSSSERTD